MISRILYDDQQQALSIWFHGSGRYVYSDVPRDVYEELRQAPSPGRFFNARIKGRFRFAFDPDRRRFGDRARHGTGQGGSSLSRS